MSSAEPQKHVKIAFDGEIFVGKLKEINHQIFTNPNIRL